jgi:hypothetical protein
MFNRGFALIAAAAAGVAASYSSAAAGPSTSTPDGNFFVSNRPGKGKGNKRGKGAVSRPKKRPNRKIVSKRVRAKHRKAARRA